MTRGWWSSLVLTGVVSAALTACGVGEADSGGGIDPIEIATPSADAGTQISLDIPLDESGAFAFDQWPSACDLVDEETIKTIFPQTEGVQQHGTDAQIRVLSLGLGAAQDKSPKTVNDATCVTRVGFTQAGLGLSDNVTVLVVNSQIVAAGSPKFVERNFRKSTAGEDIELGDTTCTRADSGRTYECNVGKIAFKLTIDMRQHAQYVGGNGSDYVIDGKTVTYNAGDPDFDAVVADKVSQPLVSATVGRLD